jgi:hypothetical protein
MTSEDMAQPPWHSADEYSPRRIRVTLTIVLIGQPDMGIAVLFGAVTVALLCGRRPARGKRPRCQLLPDFASLDGRRVEPGHWPRRVHSWPRGCWRAY